MTTNILARTIVSHGVGMIFYRIGADGGVEIARHTYTKNNWTSLRVPFGTGAENEPVLITFRRECLQECGQNNPFFEADILDEIPQYVEYCDDQKRPGGLHVKFFFAATVIAGSLRDTNMLDGDELLGPIEYDEVENILHGTRDLKLIRSHRFAIMKTLAILAGKYKKVMNRYEDLLYQIAEEIPPDPTTEETEKLLAYMG